MANLYPPEMLDISKGIFLIRNKEGMKVPSVKKRLSRLVNIKNFFIMQNGRILHDSDELVTGNVYLIQRLPGGKGGFGSMLRAIGAQIEKTTNHEACRDLSGRLRDINEEKRLKSWINQQSDREREVEEKLEQSINEPNYVLIDHNYAKVRVEVGPNVTDAIDQGMQAGASHQVSRKRPTLLPPEKLAKKRRCLLVDSELASDTSSSASESVADVADLSDIVNSSKINDKYFPELGDDYSEKSCDSDDDAKIISNDSTDVDSDDSEASVHSAYLQSDSSYDELLDESYYPEQDNFPYNDTEDTESSEEEDSESGEEEDSESGEEEDSESGEEENSESDEDDDSASSDEDDTDSMNSGSESKITQPLEKDMESLEK